MRIGGGRREQDGTDAPPKGPWSDLPPPDSAGRSSSPPPRRAKTPREPIIRNWRGLVIVLLLLIVAPWVARWASAVILGLMPGH